MPDHRPKGKRAPGVEGIDAWRGPAENHTYGFCLVYGSEHVPERLRARKQLEEEKKLGPLWGRED